MNGAWSPWLVSVQIRGAAHKSSCEKVQRRSRRRCSQKCLKCTPNARRVAACPPVPPTNSNGEGIWRNSFDSSWIHLKVGSNPALRPPVPDVDPLMLPGSGRTVKPPHPERGSVTYVALPTHHDGQTQAPWPDRYARETERDRERDRQRDRQRALPTTRSRSMAQSGPGRSVLRAARCLFPGNIVG